MPKPICVVLLVICLARPPDTAAHETQAAADPATSHGYQVSGNGTRRFVWDTDKGQGWIKVLVESATLGKSDAEVAEIFFPPGWPGESHVHALEIFYVIEGELDHIVNGRSHILKPGMVGTVMAPDTVVHRSHSPEEVKILVLWPLGGEVSGLAELMSEVLPDQVPVP